MRNPFIALLTAASLLFPSCGKEDSIPTVAEEDAILRITLHTPQTKAREAGGTAAENRINDVHVFVFDGDGLLNAYKHFPGFEEADPLTLNIMSGNGKTVWILVNTGFSADYYKAYVSSLSDLRKQTFTLANNYRRPVAGAGGTGTLDSFEMWGATEPITLSSGTNEVSVTVSRVVSKVYLGKISREFTSAHLQTTDFRIVNIYMTNVTGSYGLDENENDRYRTAGKDTWHNPYLSGHISLEEKMDRWLRHAYVSPVALNQGGSINVEASFYVFPNNAPANAVEGGETAEFKLRQTKLVVEALSNGTPCFYAIPIVETGPGGFLGLRSNRCFCIDELLITRLGTDNPDIPVHTAELTSGIQVEPWDVVGGIEL